MSRYKRTSHRKLIFTKENLEDSKRKIAAGCSKRSLAKEMGINEATLRKRLKSGNLPVSFGRFGSDIPAAMEVELAQQIRDLDDRFYGITKKNLQIAAYKFAEANNIQHRFNRNKKMAGESWVKGFCQRHGITLRQPENCSMGRIMGFNRSQVNRFYENLKSLFEERQYMPSSIYNMDETGLSTVPNKLPKILTTKGKKLVGKVASADRGQLVTSVCCVSATGSYIPPAIIFPRKRMKDELFLNAPIGTLKMISESGFINTELFCQWLVHFKNYSKPCAENPVLLVLDNHSSHRDLQAIQYCRKYYIDLLSLPPHASHRLQPLDVGFFGPLKASYSRECDKWMVNNPGKVITQMHVAELFNHAYAITANIEKAQNSFKATGIFPYNPDLFQEVDFAPSFVTDAPISTDVNEENAQVTVAEDIIVNVINGQTNEEINESEVYFIPQVTPPPDINNMDIVFEDGIVIPSTSQVVDVLNRSIPASDILPLPKIKEKPNRRKAKSQKSEILSSTPFAKDLEKLDETRKAKEEKKRVAAKRKLCSASKQSNTIQTQRKKKKRNDEEDVSCPGCRGCYSKSDEDWIMCFQCRKWWHESCTTYVTGEFICFTCEG